MRKTIIAGNWKMHNDLNDTAALISGIKNGLAGKQVNCGVLICPPYTSLETAAALVKDTVVTLGAQNMHFEEKGAFTGEISADMLLSTGCEYVILGHSERRHVFGENDDIINKKVLTALKKGLKPILCVGEQLEDREAEKTFQVVEEQVAKGLANVSPDEMKNVVIAYEPVWAIGTGKTASPDQAQEVHAFIRGQLKKLYTDDIAADTTIQYGGSVKPENAKELLAQEDIDGALVGGACLKPDSFVAIIDAV